MKEVKQSVQLQSFFTSDNAKTIVNSISSLDNHGTKTEPWIERETPFQTIKASIRAQILTEVDKCYLFFAEQNHEFFQ